jgi:CBS domain-containing protein
MKKNIHCVSPEDSAQTATGMMRDENVGFLPVCDSGRKVEGTITDRDIAIRLVASGKPASTAVEQLMTREVVACEPGDDIERAKQLMALHQKSRMMCIDDQGRLAGVISLSDIVQREGGLAGETLQQITAREARM